MSCYKYTSVYNISMHLTCKGPAGYRVYAYSNKAVCDMDNKTAYGSKDTHAPLFYSMAYSRLLSVDTCIIFRDNIRLD